ncbi:MAG: hypothetical protein Q4C73_11755 [Eubacteriales bacterium]|nr:hypothetical protein [Eubacteriales bacterium]
MKRMKKWMTYGLTLLFVLAMPILTYASARGVTRGQLISTAFITATDEGNGTVGVSAELYCHEGMRKIKISLALQQWENNRWKTVDTQDFEWLAEDYPDEDLFMALVSYEVPRQKRAANYRVRGDFYAYAKGSSASESKTAYTSDLFIE